MGKGEGDLDRERERENEITVMHCMPSCAMNHILSHSNIAHFPTLSLSCTGGGLSVNYSSDEVTPTLQEYATQLMKACPALSSASSSMKSRGMREGGKRRESGDGGQENSRLTIITGAPLTLLSLPSPSSDCHSYPSFHSL